MESAVVSRKDYADSAAFDAALLDTLQSHNIDVVVLAGFLSVLGDKVIAAYPRPHPQCSSQPDPQLLRARHLRPARPRGCAGPGRAS